MLRRVTLWTAAATAWWTAEGLIAGYRSREMLESAGVTDTWTWVYLPSLATGWLWVPFTIMAFVLAERMPIQRHQLRHVWVHLLGLTITIVLRAVTVVLLNDEIPWYPELPPFADVLETSAFNNLFTYGFITAAAHAVYFAHQHRLRQAQLASAQLQALRAQMRPHFLFNVLNTIAALIPERPAAAERMTVELGELLRAALKSDAKVALGEELSLVRAYLDIEQIRFADRITVKWKLDPTADDCIVPALLLQPLVENAVRHGLAPRAAPGEVTITTNRDDEWLKISVADDGVGVDAGKRIVDGVGLSNTKARLAQLWPGRHRFELVPDPSGGTIAHVVIPREVE